MNLQARQEQPGYGRLVSPITPSTQTWWAEGDSNSHAEAAFFENAVYSRSTIGPNKKPPDYDEPGGLCLPLVPP